MRVDNLGYKPTPSWRRQPEECGIGFWKLLRLYLKKGYGPLAAVRAAWRLRSWEVAVYPHNESDLAPPDATADNDASSASPRSNPPA